MEESGPLVVFPWSHGQLLSAYPVWSLPTTPLHHPPCFSPCPASGGLLQVCVISRLCSCSQESLLTTSTLIAQILSWLLPRTPPIGGLLPSLLASRRPCLGVSFQSTQPPFANSKIPLFTPLRTAFPQLLLPMTPKVHLPSLCPGGSLGSFPHPPALAGWAGQDSNLLAQLPLTSPPVWIVSS